MEHGATRPVSPVFERQQVLDIDSAMCTGHVMWNLSPVNEIDEKLPRNTQPPTCQDGSSVHDILALQTPRRGRNFAGIEPLEQTQP